MRRHFDIVVLVLAVRHVGERARWGSRRAPSRAPSIASLLLASSLRHRRLERGDFGLQRPRRAWSFRAIAWPISFEAALRRSCAFCNRRSPRGASRRARSACRQRGSSPRRARPSSKALRIVADELDVMHGCDPIRNGEAAMQPVAEHVEGQPRHYQTAPKSSNAPSGSPNTSRARDHADDRISSANGATLAAE